MARHFGAQHMKASYSAMGNHPNRPRYAGLTGRTIAQSIAREKAKAEKANRIKR